jgi:hypothetical protein
MTVSQQMEPYVYKEKIKPDRLKSALPPGYFKSKSNENSQMDFYKITNH